MTYTTEIVYNRESHDYDMLLNGEYIGSRPDYHTAELTLDNLVYAALTHTPDAITDTIDPETNHRCGDCGAALSEFGLCEECPVPVGSTVRLPSSLPDDDYHLTGVIIAAPGFTEQYSAGPIPYYSIDFDCTDGTAENLWLERSEFELVEPKPGIDPGDHGGPSTIGRPLTCPSCDASTRTSGMCAACRVEATTLLHSEELTFSQYMALALAGPAERFLRAPEHDRRIGDGDVFAGDFDGDAWQDRRTGEIRWTAVGCSPNGKIGGSEADPDLALAIAGAG